LGLGDRLLSRQNIDLAASLRNYYTHFDPRTEAKLPPSEGRILAMHDLAVRLRVLCELVLLNAAGFQMEKIRESIRTTRRLER
jgi:hypothetical protein